MRPSLPDKTARPSPQSAIPDAFRRHVLGGVHLGTLNPDDWLASVRAVAAELHAHPRVVLAIVHRNLETEGEVARQRSGRARHAGSRPWAHSRTP